MDAVTADYMRRGPVRVRARYSVAVVNWVAVLNLRVVEQSLKSVIVDDWLIILP